MTRSTVWNSILDDVALMDGDPAFEHEALLSIYARLETVAADDDPAAFAVKSLVSVLLANAGVDAAEAVGNRSEPVDLARLGTVDRSNVITFPRGSVQ